MQSSTVGKYSENTAPRPTVGGEPCPSERSCEHEWIRLLVLIVVVDDND